MARCREDQIYVIGVEERRIGGDARHLIFRTTCGDFDAIARLGRGIRQAVVMLGGGRGSVAGPSSIYPELADELYSRGIGSMRITYRQPGVCAKCAIDTLIALQYLDDEGVPDVVLAGWSFGGAVALATGSIARTVRGVAAISTLDVADCCVRRLRARPVLLLHGEADSASPVEVSRRIYDESFEPRKLIVYPAAGHRLREVRRRALEDLLAWSTDILQLHRAAA